MIVIGFIFALFLLDFVETLELTTEVDEVEFTSEKVTLETVSQLNVVQGKSGQNDWFGYWHNNKFWG